MRLSIVTVCFNAEDVIEKTILSILEQTHPIYEYIFIDGLSTDSTAEIIIKYKEKIEKKNIIFKFVSEKDKGISDAFNKGINLATGDVIGLINADDELLPNTCEIIDKYWKEKKSDIYYGNCLWVDDEKGISYINKPTHDLKKLLYYMILIHPSTFVTKRAYQEVGLFNDTYKYCMDKELLYRMYIAEKKFTYVDETLTKYKAGGISDRQAINVYKEGSRMALMYGEPMIKVMLVQYKKIIRKVIASKLRNVKFFQRMKMKIKGE